MPYFTHLMAVAAIAGEFGGSEDQIVAALLHDAPEDQGGRAMLDTIRARFGATVADLVEACTDTFETPKPPWKRRKLDYIAGIPKKPLAARLIIAADKIHNLRSMYTDYQTVGNRLWDRFTASREETLWYYKSVHEAIANGWSNPILIEYARSFVALENYK